MAKKKKRHFWLNVIVVMITVMVVLSSLFWLVAFHFYNVSSNSMAPALQATPKKSDRLLCWNLAFLFRKPVRWEVVTFNTPSNSGNTIIGGMDTGGEEGLTVKRLAGLEDERLAISGGDIWTRPLADASAPFRRQVKPDSVQHGMWIEVYRSELADRTVPEFLLAWDNPDEKIAIRNGVLLMPEDSAITYVPKARVGTDINMRMLTLPGIPDRYMLPQELFFHCSNCGNDFSRHEKMQVVFARCPVCGLLNEETSVAFYELRSGLPETGKFHVGDARQGDMTHFRNNTYNFVSDLKITLEVRLLNPGSAFRANLRGQDGVASAVFKTNGASINDRALGGNQGALKPGEWTRVEFYLADGAARLFLGENRAPLFDRVLWKGEVREDEYDGGQCGIVLQALGGDVEIRDFAMSRDVHYFSGRRQGMGRYLAAMDEDGQIDVPVNHFFPLGDNTTVSLDGRSWGAVDMSLLKGTALYIWSPRERAGRIPTP